MLAVFELQVFFLKSAPNDPNMTLNTTTSYVPHIGVTNIHESQILLRSAVRPTVFSRQAIFRQVH